VTDGTPVKRKLLVIIDDTPECERALHYAALRARRTGATVLAAVVAARSEFQHWLGVEERMREDAEVEANEMLDRAFRKLATRNLDEPERRIVIANRIEGIREIIGSDPSIAVLILAAAPGSDGPGPLVNAIANNQSGAYPVPIMIVPGGLSTEEIEAIA